MTTRIDRLDRLIDETRRNLDALERTRALLTGDATERKVNGQASVLADALALDTARSTRAGQRVSEETRARQQASWTPARRAAQAARMRRLNPHARKTKLAPDYHTNAGKAVRRAGVLQMLNAFDRETPRTIADAGLTPQQAKGLGSALRHGYLKKTKRGYLRTAQEFIP